MESQPPPENDHENPRRGKARERHEKRQKGRRGERPSWTGFSGQDARPARSSHRQIRPTGAFKLPDLSKLPIKPIAYGLGALGFVIAIILGLAVFKNDGTEPHPNAIWLGTEWTYETHDDADVLALVKRLQENQIGTVYAWVSWLQEDGTWRGVDSFPNVRTFASQFKHLAPDMELHAWLGLPVNLGENGYRLDDEKFQQTIAAFSRTVTADYAFDGVFLNVEPVWNGDENYLDLLRAVRTSIGTEKMISTAIPPDWRPLDAEIPVPPLIEPGTEWDKTYKQRVALLTDEMALMAYNSGLSAPLDYSVWVAYQVQTYAEAFAEIDTKTKLLVGIPTYGEALPAHDPLVENVQTAIAGIRSGLTQAGNAASFVNGVALYAEWETDDTEWTQFNTDWVNRR